MLPIIKLNSLRRFLCRPTKNEFGFFTIIGLCLLLAIAISIKGIQEFESTYATSVSNFGYEHDLQNYAESALIKAIEETIPEDTKKNTPFKIDVNPPVISERLKDLNANVEVYCVLGNIQRLRRNYSSKERYTDDIKIKDDTGKDWARDGRVYMSVASCDSPSVAGKIYRRAMAYTLDEETVCTMEDGTVCTPKYKIVYFMTDL